VEFVEKRYGKDSQFVLKADKSVEAVRAWTEKIFTEEGTEDFKLPKAIWEWFVEVILTTYPKAESELIRRMILVKVIHTREVVRAGYDIAGGEKEFDWNQYRVGTVCLLHDIARFDQALLGSYSDGVTNYDHAAVGAEMIEKRNFTEAELEGVQITSVIEAVKCHSAYAYEGNNYYAKLARDADKLALLRSMPEILAAEIGGFPEGDMTEEALSAYKKGEMVRHRNMKTRADLFLAWLAWEFDMNFAETKRLFVEEGIKEWMIAELKQRGVNLD
jgi:HD superfamily phosphodiesterase